MMILVEDIANCRAGGGQGLQAILSEAGITLAMGDTTNSECWQCTPSFVESIVMDCHGRLASAFEDHRVHLKLVDGAQWVENAVQQHRKLICCTSWKSWERALYNEVAFWIQGW